MSVYVNLFATLKDQRSKINPTVSTVYLCQEVCGQVGEFDCGRGNRILLFLLFGILGGRFCVRGLPGCPL